MTRTPLRVGLVGVGNFGRLHAEVLAALPEVQLVAVADLDANRATAVAERFGVAGQFADGEGLLESARPDALVVAAADPAHVPLALAALGRGMPVFVEKPLAPDLTGARAILAEARRRGGLVQVGTLLRFSVPHAQLRAAIADGALGEVVHVRSVRHITRAWHAASATHPALRTAIHDIDLVLYFAGRRVGRVVAHESGGSATTAPLSVAALLRLEGGGSAVVEAHYRLPPSYPANTPPGERPGTRDGRVEVVGTRGLARLPELQGAELWTDEGARCGDSLLVARVAGGVEGALRRELEHFAACVRAGRPSTVVPLEEAVHGVAVAEAIVDAARTGREVAVPAEEGGSE